MIARPTAVDLNAHASPDVEFVRLELARLQRNLDEERRRCAALAEAVREFVAFPVGPRLDAVHDAIATYDELDAEAARRGLTSDSERLVADLAKARTHVAILINEWPPCPHGADACEPYRGRGLTCPECPGPCPEAPV